MLSMNRAFRFAACRPSRFAPSNETPSNRPRGSCIDAKTKKSPHDLDEQSRAISFGKTCSSEFLRICSVTTCATEAAPTASNDSDRQAITH